MLECNDLITHVQQVEQQLEQVRTETTQLRALSQRLIAMLESERRHMAQLVLNEIAQPLSILKLLIEKSITRVPARAHALLDKGPALLAEIIAQLREVSLDLRPAMLDELGLLPTLLTYVEGYTSRTQVQVILLHSGLGRRLPSDIETVAYRIVQETLSNVARHAGVDKARIYVKLTPSLLILQIEDQGSGFDVEAKLLRGTACGLIEMQERARGAGGQLRVESKPGTGTRVTAKFPLHQAR
ncbi:MAG: sensor histidine kinase [Candidatus Entotheonellia bacterium]